MVVWIYGRQRRWLIMGWLWYLGTLVPVIGLVQAGPQAMADRFTYVPMLGLFVAGVWGLAELSRHFPFGRWGAGFLGVVGGHVHGAGKQGDAVSPMQQLHAGIDKTNSQNDNA